MSLYNELPIAFPWYEKQEQQDRYRENTQGLCTYKLISPKNSLLPFQFRKAGEGNVPTTWEIFEANTMTSMGVISASISLIRMSFVDGLDYFTFPGDPIPGLLLPAGYYFSILSFPGSVQQFSEVFFVPPVGAFNVEADAIIDFLKLTWYDLKDINPIYYNEQGPDGLPYFKNVAYLDSFVTSSEPQIIEDGTKDGDDELIPTFQKAIINYRISAPMAEFLKKAITLIQMHDFVILTTQRGIRSGELQKALVNAELSDNGGMSFVDIVFQETVAMVKKGCNDNLKRPGCPGNPTRLDTISDGSPTTNYLFAGYAPIGTTVQFYGTNTIGGIKTLIPGATASDVDFVAGVQFAKSLFDGYQFIAAKATSLGCDYGFSKLQDKAFIIPVAGLILVFISSSYPVADPLSVSDWNTFFATDTNAEVPFSDVTIDESTNTVTLLGARALQTEFSLFQGTDNLQKVIDTDGVITVVKSNTFNTCTSLTEVNLQGCLQIQNQAFENALALAIATIPKVTEIQSQGFATCPLINVSFPLCTTIGSDCFDACNSLVTIDLSGCTSLGGSFGDDFVFNGISGQTIALTIKTALATDGDVVYLQANNTVTLTLV